MNLLQFERKVYLYQDRVYGFAYYFLNDRDEAQDVTQEVLIRLWKHCRDVDEERLLGWLLRVTRNACIDALRKRKSFRGMMTVSTDEVLFAKSSDLSPEDSTTVADTRNKLIAAVDRLPDPYRSIVILREIQDLKYEEISGAMDMPLNTVKVYLHRGRKMLREQLREVMDRENV